MRSQSLGVQKLMNDREPFPFGIGPNRLTVDERIASQNGEAVLNSGPSNAKHYKVSVAGFLIAVGPRCFSVGEMEVYLVVRHLIRVIDDCRPQKIPAKQYTPVRWKGGVDLRNRRAHQIAFRSGGSVNPQGFLS